MFNRQPFNRGRFNRSLTAANSVLLYGGMSLELEAAAERLNTASTFRGDAALLLSATGKMTYSASIKGDVLMLLTADGYLARTRTIEGDAFLHLSAGGQIIRARRFTGNALLMLIAYSSEGFNTYREERISFTVPGFIFRVGDELIIDMENMTATINGQNVMRFLDRDSEFFNLNPGNNEVTYESTITAGRVDLRILWKDAWI